MTTGERIRLIRKQHHMNQTEFAKELSISTTSVCQLEMGKYQIARTTKRILCSRFRINPVWLETGEGEMHVTGIAVEDMIPDIMRVLDNNQMICKFVETAIRLFSDKDWKMLDAFLNWTSQGNSPEKSS